MILNRIKSFRELPDHVKVEARKAINNSLVAVGFVVLLFSEELIGVKFSLSLIAVGLFNMIMDINNENK